MAPELRRFRVVTSEDGMMLGKFVARRLRLADSDQGRELVRAGGVYVGKHRVRIPSVRVQSGERVTIYPQAASVPPLDPATLRFVHQDADFVVLDKPPGVPVAPTRASARGCLSEALIAWLEIQGVARPYVGVVHRLDQAASGLVLFTIRGAVGRNLQRQFEAHTLERRYLALLRGRTPKRWSCDLPLPRASGGHVRPGRGPARPAQTDFVRLALHQDPAWGPCSLVEARLQTGRTHQIRVHAAESGHPIVGDHRYGPASEAATPASSPDLPLHLHAAHLAFDHPTRGHRVTLEAPPPPWAAKCDV